MGIAASAISFFTGPGDLGLRACIRQLPLWAQSLVFRLRQQDIDGFASGIQPGDQAFQAGFGHRRATGGGTAAAIAPDMEKDRGARPRLHLGRRIVGDERPCNWLIFSDISTSLCVLVLSAHRDHSRQSAPEAGIGSPISNEEYRDENDFSHH